MAHKLIFIETRDVCETRGAIAKYRHACDCGKGAVLFCVTRGKVAEGVEFSGHYGRCAMLMGVPYQVITQ